MNEKNRAEHLADEMMESVSGGIIMKSVGGNYREVDPEATCENYTCKSCGAARGCHAEGCGALSNLKDRCAICAHWEHDRNRCCLQSM